MEPALRRVPPAARSGARARGAVGTLQDRGGGRAFLIAGLAGSSLGAALIGWTRTPVALLAALSNALGAIGVGALGLLAGVWGAVGVLWAVAGCGRVATVLAFLL